MMTGRLIVAIVTTILEEAALVAIVLWGLPEFGIQMPLWGLITLMGLLAANAVFFFTVGSRALRRRPFAGVGSAVGSQAKVVKPLEPEGIVRIGDELWEARITGSHADIGDVVTVMEQDGLKLTVTKTSAPPETKG